MEKFYIFISIFALIVLSFTLFRLFDRGGRIEENYKKIKKKK